MAELQDGPLLGPYPPNRSGTTWRQTFAGTTNADDSAHTCDNPGSTTPRPTPGTPDTGTPDTARPTTARPTPARPAPTRPLARMLKSPAALRAAPSVKLTLTSLPWICRRSGQDRAGTAALLKSTWRMTTRFPVPSVAKTWSIYRHADRTARAPVPNDGGTVTAARRLKSTMAVDDWDFFGGR